MVYEVPGLQTDIACSAYGQVQATQNSAIVASLGCRLERASSKRCRLQPTQLLIAKLRWQSGLRAAPGPSKVHETSPVRTEELKADAEAWHAASCRHWEQRIQRAKLSSRPRWWVLQGMCLSRLCNTLSSSSWPCASYLLPLMRQVPSGAADEPERAVSHSEEEDEDPPEDESVLVLADGPQMGDFASTSTPSASQPLAGCSPRSCEGGAASAPDLTSAAAATGGEEGEQHCFSAYAVSPDF